MVLLLAVVPYSALPESATVNIHQAALHCCRDIRFLLVHAGIIDQLLLDVRGEANRRRS
jgi:hypothetical protein